MKNAVFPIAPSWKMTPTLSADQVGLILQMPGIPSLVLPLDKRAISQLRTDLDQVEAFLNKSGTA